MVALIVFIIATLEIVFGRKKLFDQKVHLAIGDNVLRNLWTKTQVPSVYRNTIWVLRKLRPSKTKT